MYDTKCNFFEKILGFSIPGYENALFRILGYEIDICIYDSCPNCTFITTSTLNLQTAISCDFLMFGRLEINISSLIEGSHTHLESNNR
jgi:hypothetical protein